MMDTLTQVERLIELAIIQRSELRRLVEELPQLKAHLSEEIERTFEETEPQLRAELEEWTTKQTADKTAALGVALEAKIADLAKSLEVSTQARYNAIIAERAENARLAAEAEAKIAEHAASLPGAVKEIVSAELARFPRAGEIDQLRKEFAEPKSLNPRGKWVAGETYNKLDLVTINGDSYVSNIDGNTEKPSRSAGNWTLNAARGNSGGGGGITSLNDILNAPTSGQIIGSENSQYVPKTLVAGTGITITDDPSTITIDASGAQEILTATVKNAESVAITRGQVVYLFSATGGFPSVKLAFNTSDATSAKTFGVVSDVSIAPNGTGTITCVGVVSNLNLGAYNDGDTVYLGATPGSFTATKPYAPNHLVYVGIIERANAGNGELYVRIQNGYELDEIHDVQINSPLLAGQTLIYDATTDLWKNARLTAGVGVSISNGDSAITISADGGVNYQGTWNASTNTPTLTSSVGTKGFYYVVSVAGSTNLNGVTDWKVGDWAIFNGTAWEKVDTTDQVSSVFGRTGAVVGVSTDYSAVGITNTAIGATNPSTGAFTTLSATGNLTVNGGTVDNSPASGGPLFRSIRPANTGSAAFASIPNGALSASNVEWYSGLIGSSGDYKIWAYNGSTNTFAFSSTPAGNVTLAGNLTVSGTDYNYVGGNKFFRGFTNYNVLYTGATELSINNQADGANLASFKNNGNFLIGTAVDSSALLQVGTNTTTAAGGMKFGTDTSLYRSAAGQLRGPSSFIDATFASSGLFFGASMTLQANDNVLIKTNGSVTALTLDTSQNATFAGNVKANGGYFQGPSGADLGVVAASGRNLKLYSDGGILGATIAAGTGDTTLAGNLTVSGATTVKGQISSVTNSTIIVDYVTGSDYGRLLSPNSSGAYTTAIQIVNPLTVGGNLTVSGTGTSSFGGKIQSSVATATGYNQLYDTTGITTGRGAFGITSTGAGLAFGIEASVGGTSFTGSTAYASYFGTTTATPIHFVTNAAISATLTSSGNLGIGTTDIQGKLHVRGSQADPLLRLGYEVAGQSYLDFLRTSVDAVPVIQSGYGVDGSFALAINPSGGNLLIGTTTDGGQKLQVSGTSNFSNPGSSTIANFTNSANADFQIVLTASTSAKIGPSTPTSLILQTNGTTALTLDSSQNATFAGAVTINGGAAVYGGGALLLGGTGGGSGNGVYTTDTGSPTMYMDHRGTNNTGDFYWRNGTAGANTRMSLSGAGVLYVANGTAPGSNPSSGGYLYVESGALKYRGSSGTVTTIANA